MRRLINFMVPTFNKGRYIRGMVWSNKLSIGNVIIDSEHRNLMRTVNDAIHAIQTRDNLTLAQELKHLDSWLCTHFANEEKSRGQLISHQHYSNLHSNIRGIRFGI